MAKVLNESYDELYLYSLFIDILSRLNTKTLKLNLVPK
jgi:hypothetical protein